MKPLIVNLFGAPSAGKSTGAAYIFSKLKLRGVNAELVTEFAKDKVWEESKEVFNNQAYIFGKQYFRISRLHGKVDVAITDAPLLNSLFYNKNSLLGDEFEQLVYKVFMSYDSLNYYLLRDKPYNPAGRFQTEVQSNEISSELKKMLDICGVDYKTIKGNELGYDYIVEEIISRLD